MKEAEATHTPIRTMYSLVEAAALTRCSVENLLKHGAQERLPILARVPDNVLVYCTNLDLLDLADPTLIQSMRRMKESYLDGLRPLARQDIQLLVLKPANCDLIASHGEAHQTEFLTGVAFSGACDPVFVEPPALGAHDGYYDMRPFRRFACYSVGHDPCSQGIPRRTLPTKIKLTTDMLRVRRDDLVLLGLLHVADVGSTKFDNGFREEPHMSERLIFLNKGASRFWDCSRPGWSAPLVGKVEQWFREECGFRVKVAEGAAQILRQSYKDWDQEMYEKNKAQDKLNMFDAVVLIATEWANADLGRGDRADQIDTYPKRKDVLEKLKTRFDFAHHTALAAWNIARPEEAKTIGRPRDYDDGM